MVLRIVDLDGLLRLKLRAGGPQDLMDAAHLILQHPDRIATAREAARAYRLEDKLDVWLNDPRTRSQVEEELRARGAEGRTVLKQLTKVLPKPSSRRKKS
jgi:inorganic triphosphatase YgiF